jgi:hypothetical protein
LKKLRVVLVEDMLGREAAAKAGDLDELKAAF